MCSSNTFVASGSLVHGLAGSVALISVFPRCLHPTPLAQTYSVRFVFVRFGQISFLVQAVNASGRKAEILRALSESPTETVPRLSAQILADEKVTTFFRLRFYSCWYCYMFFLLRFLLLYRSSFFTYGRLFRFLFRFFFSI